MPNLGLKPHQRAGRIILPARAERPPARDFLAAVLAHFEASAARLRLQAPIRDRIATPEHVTTVHFTVRMDDGSDRPLVFRRVRQSTALGPAKGGIRWAKGAGENVVRALAFEMPLKPSLYGLPLGGAKGGIDIDPSELSVRESAAVMRGSIRAAMDEVWRSEGALAFGPKTDVPAPDVGTSHPEINLMDLAVDEYLGWLVDNQRGEADGFVVPAELTDVKPGAETETPYLDRYLQLFEQGKIDNLGLIATFTGKSVDKGGSLGRTAATGLGVAYATIEMLKHDGRLPPDAQRFTGQTVAVQGFGNVGLGALKAFVELDARVVALQEFDGSPYALYRPGGFDRETIDEMIAFKKAHGTLRGFPGAEVLRPAAFWKLPVDVLAPCAKENELTETIARTLAAPYVTEGANGPTAEGADRRLERRGITVLPDIFANAAGVIVSWFEMLQNMRGERWSLERVMTELHEQMSLAFHALAEVRDQGQVTFREAAFDRAVHGLAAALV